jgi:hypothetical protein
LYSLRRSEFVTCLADASLAFRKYPCRMSRTYYHRLALSTSILAACALTYTGCGTTRSTDTTRTATEQLLISDAIDRSVQAVNVQTLAGQTVYFDDSRLGEVVDRNYLISTLRQHLLASGCALRAERDQADYIVEARAGAIGTDRNDLLFGVPSMNVPQILPVQPVPAAIPEIPFAKRRDQRGIAKIAVFAYHRETGTPVWQSGVAHQESSANDVWILGAGPFQRGTIYEGTAFAGKTIGHDESEDEKVVERSPPVDLARGRVFTTPQQIAAKEAAPAANSPQAVVTAVHNEPVHPVVRNQPAAPAEPAAAAADVPTAPVPNTAQASPPAPQPLR